VLNTVKMWLKCVGFDKDTETIFCFMLIRVVFDSRLKIILSQSLSLDHAVAHFLAVTGGGSVGECSRLRQLLVPL